MNTINLNGSSLPFKFGANAVRVYKKDFGRNFFKDAQTMKDDFDIEVMIGFVYVGLKEGCRKANKQVNFTVEDVADWLDEPNGFQTAVDSFKLIEFGNFVSDTEKKSKGVRKA